MSNRESGFGRKIRSLSARKGTCFYILPKPSPGTEPEVSQQFEDNMPQNCCGVFFVRYSVDYSKYTIICLVNLEHFMFQNKKESCCSCFCFEETRSAPNLRGK
jgi:hypothetical protein